MNLIASVILRSAVSLIFLFILTKIVGKKQMSQLSYFDYISGITIGSIASVAAVESDIPAYLPIIAMAVYAAVTVGADILTNKSIKLRKIITGEPTILIYKGNLLKENMNKVRVDIEELLAECRTLGYFDISQIYYAVIESTGKISILPKEANAPATKQDLNVPLTQTELPATVIIDGRIMTDNLAAMGRDESWLFKQLNTKDLKDILLATMTPNGALSVHKRANNEKTRSILW